MGTLKFASNPAEVPTGTLAQLFFDTVDADPSRVAVRSFIDEGPQLRDTTYAEVLETVRGVVGGLRNNDIARGDRVALMSRNRPEWAATDYGCICAGVVDVPMYDTLAVDQVEYVLKDSGAQLVFVAGEDELARVLDARDELTTPPGIVVFDPPAELPEGVEAWATFIAAGQAAMAEVSPEEFKKEALTAQPDDLMTLIYTSGTTGSPKGVMLSHGNLYSNVRASASAIRYVDGDLAMSFLPLSHVFQRMVDYLTFWSRVPIAYAHSIHTVAADFRIVRPTVAVSVPRLYEKIYNKVMEAEGLKKRLVQWGREVGDAWATETLAGREPSPVLKFVYAVADRLVFRKIRAGVGGRMRHFTSGGAPLAPELAKFFYSVGLPIMEGYGLTETSPVTNVNTPEAFRIGTVGKLVPGTQLQIADDGEILVRGPQVMLGYFNRPDATAEAIEAEGWFHTGDIGEIDQDGFLKITDRKKDLIVTAGGKNIAPQSIENRLKTNDFVEQAVLIGDRRNFLSLLVVPALPNLRSWAGRSGIKGASVDDLLKNTEVQEFMVGEIMRGLSGLSNYETPKKFALLRTPFSIEDGTLTPTQKVKRRVVEGRHQQLIESFYQEENVDQTVFVERG